MAVAYGWSALELPDSIEVIWLSTSNLVESTFSSLMSPLDVNPQASLAVSVDAEMEYFETVRCFCLPSRSSLL